MQQLAHEQSETKVLLDQSIILLYTGQVRSDNVGYSYKDYLDQVNINIAIFPLTPLI